jgi:hypothetical protein
MIPDSIPAGAPRGEKVLFNTFRDCCLTTSLCGTRHRVFVVSRLLVRTVRSLLVKLEALESANSQKAEVLAHTVSQHLNRQSESGAK